MCGRFSLSTLSDTLEQRFKAKFALPDYRPHYNIAPSQFSPAILSVDRDQIVPAYWGYIPSWQTEPDLAKGGVINARAETIAVKSYFKKSFLERRCLILADGFFEWRKIGKGKVPYRISLTDGQPFAFAGVWTRIHSHLNGEVITFAIITTVPNDLIAPIHDRMPVMLLPDQEERWLTAEPKQAHELLRPYPAELLAAYPVSTLVNSPRHDVPDVIRPSA